ncbi:MAG: shikimate dehydrogenase [Dehalococcoidia bacterium]
MTRTAGLIGHPVAHSLSPVFQNAAFQHCGLDVVYTAWDTPVARLRTRMQRLRSAEMLGANVTIPHKQAVMPHIDELGDFSRRVGAVNTIVNREGRLFGFNTDGPGFVQSLKDERNFDPRGANVLVFGAGGAARGIVLALVDAGAAVSIANRTPSRAEDLAHTAGAGARAVRQPGDLAAYDVLVNTTSIGMEGTGTEDQSPSDFLGARPGAFAVDIVYAPERTTFLRDAEAAGLRTLGGLAMLVYQGALAFTYWTGIHAPVEVMFDAARNELARRGPAR